MVLGVWTRDFDFVEAEFNDEQHWIIVACSDGYIDRVFYALPKEEFIQKMLLDECSFMLVASPKHALTE